MENSASALEKFLGYAGARRAQVKAAAWGLIALIAWTDWVTGPSLSIGFLYIIPVIMVSALLSRRQIALLAVVCGVLLEHFHGLAWQPSLAIRIPLSVGGFALAGYFISELERSRRLVLLHLGEVERQTALRRDAEKQMRVLIETSPLAILTLDRDAKVTVANQSAGEVLGFEEGGLAGEPIGPYLPILERLVKAPRPTGELRTTVECKGHRRGGEVFLAHLWLSTYISDSGPALAAVVWDASENLRDREGTGLDSLMETSRVIIGAFAHEMRNLSAAAARTHEAMHGLPAAATPEYQALGAILGGLEKLASSGLQLASNRAAEVADLGTVLDEARIVIEPSIREAGGTTRWCVPGDLPRVRADHHSLLQVFLNLARNSAQAIEGAPVRQLEVGVAMETDLVVVRFRDTGGGVSDPDRLFRPFQSGARSAGLGLYVSRAMLRSQGGDLRYEPQPEGACFAVELWPAEEGRAA